MASPCEVHVGTPDRETAQRIVELAAGEATRLEAKFSRYRRGSEVYAINTAGGRPVVVDDETTRLQSTAYDGEQIADLRAPAGVEHRSSSNGRRGEGVF